jgi:hypothetical protein
MGEMQLVCDAVLHQFSINSDRFQHCFDGSPERGEGGLA